MRIDWTQNEVELVVAGYFAMWGEVRAGHRVNKAERYRALAALLPGRNPDAVSSKCQNISAVLRDFGFGQWCPGLKPFGHYQMLLAQGVLEWLDADLRWLDDLSAPLGTSQDADEAPPDAEEAPPDARDPLVEAIGALSTGRPRRVLDFIARDQRNRELGEKGEAFVVDREQRRLHDTDGQPDLARRVEWVSKTQGDGLGYDIRSFNSDGTDRLIEVKTTNYGKPSPFFVTRKEVRVSRERANEYHLCRVFEFSKKPRVYRLTGALDVVCHLEAELLKAWVR